MELIVAEQSQAVEQNKREKKELAEQPEIKFKQEQQKKRLRVWDVKIISARN
ncbi:hypothetical protein [Dyadobacter chenhuakuii]|uniref:Uncharacterized protein n=1 Tax=Dyadobacter chenhuakuii TaxID=2909339 RepID=A0ABY5E746_9BACT|nr:hypothetical protein [Dyadobacter chenhuakuii]UTM21796.1 hypothetical protein NFI80_25315 [Dyadobacter chenhuakuii]